MSTDTIYAVSSGRPPAAITIMRVSGDGAGGALLALAGRMTTPRMATLRALRSAAGELLDRALVLWFPGPESATGEDVVEFHLHGGVAVVGAVSRALAELGLRHAEPGEFTRRAVENGRLDLNEAEGLADLLAAETETQRREAMLRTSGVLARELEGWTDRVIGLAAEAERALDYDEEGGSPPDLDGALRALHADLLAALGRPPAERLRDGIRVAIVGPVNAGKSSLFNALVGADAAIVTPVEGTTRDVIEKAVAIDGTPFLFLDTAGRRETADAVERIGIRRAHEAADTADIVIDLSDPPVPGPRRLAIRGKADLDPVRDERLAVSPISGEGLTRLVAELQRRAAALLPGPGEVSLTRRHREGLAATAQAVSACIGETDLIIVAHHLGIARRQLDLLTGRGGVDDLLDALFGRFCLGK